MRPPALSRRSELFFNPAANLRLDGLTITELTFLGATRDITVANSRFTGMATVRSDEMVRANILFDRNTHAGIDVCQDCYEGRLQIAGESAEPSGITIQNSVFGPGGNADGIQIGANGVQVLNNEFVGIHQIGPVHTDSLQLYVGTNTVIKGNYFHDFDVAIMAPDGGTKDQITDNVFVNTSDYRPAIQLGSHAGTLFAHNVTKNIDVHVAAKDEPAAGERKRHSRQRRAQRHVSRAGRHMPELHRHAQPVQRGRAGRHRRDLGQRRVFVGGDDPADGAGWMLAPGSPGAGAASDGANRGIRAPAGPTAAPDA